jgi:RNA polymerase sigma-70 factor, ECF subfamily
VTPDLDASGSPSPDLEQLMERYQRGDQAAAQELVDLVSGRLCALLSSPMGSRTQADDMLQEVWLRLHQARHTYRPGEPVLPWMYAIARRVRVDNYRRRRRIEFREVASETLHNTPGLARPAPALPSFGELIAPLPESQREVLIMLKVNGLSIDEVARATSSTVGSVKQKVHRAYNRLRDLLTRAGSGQPGMGEES